MPEDATEETLVVGRDGSWVESASRTRTELGPSLRRIVALLLARHREEPGRTTTTWELLDAGWPGEVVLPEAGPNRVYVAVKRIRDAGLRGVVERHEDGYRISPLARFTEIG